ncbi:hypothetical protein ACNUDN_21420 [Mycobacterium sp. smrl_JER01]|uniref:hypothetical protein n=1 Tax=Mycobacterium sp. smrl_JER01 TaxID=3402633 RepID=UPI003ACC4CCB
MAAIIEGPHARRSLADETRRTWLTALFALAASLGVMLLATPGAVSPVAYWAVSSIALTTALVVFVAGGHAWDRMLVSARAAGLVGN